MSNKILTLFLALFLVACSTSNRRSTLGLMGGAAVSGYVVGASQAPVGEKPSSHGALWGATAAALAAAIGLYVFDSEKENQKLNKKVKDLNFELSLTKKTSQPISKDQGSSLFSAPIPEKLRALVQPGGWKLYRLDRWERDPENENIWFHKNEMFEVLPPQFSNQ